MELRFAFQFFPRQFAGTADCFSFLSCLFFRRFFEVLLQLHLLENTFALKLLFQNSECLIDVVVANTDLHLVFSTFEDLPE